MELIVIPTGGGKYSITDTKDRKIYSVTKKRKLVGNPITTLHDASGYELYTMIRTEAGKRPSFQIIFNDALFMRVKCRSLFVDPCVLFEGETLSYELKGREYKHLKLRCQGELAGELVTEIQPNNEPKYRLTVDDRFYDDYIPLFAVAADKCFNGTNK